MNHVQTRVTIQKAEDLRRLADQGERRGIRILLTADGEHFATSNTSAVTLHRVSRQGCDCKGFTYWGRCTHHALLLSQLGALPDPDPDVLVSERPSDRCRCGGAGFTKTYTGGGLDNWIATPCRCTQHAA
ncbi:MAG: hypothetical protein M3Q71_08155 [Chloroflexota bacterium]|nr:hypothetical protein [Chloroflexota bacterium]